MKLFFFVIKHFLVSVYMERKSLKFDFQKRIPFQYFSFILRKIKKNKSLLLSPIYMYLHWCHSTDSQPTVECLTAYTERKSLHYLIRQIRSTLFVQHRAFYVALSSVTKKQKQKYTQPHGASTCTVFFSVFFLQCP